MSEAKKKIFGPLEISVFVIAVILLAYIGLKSGGGSIIEKTEQVEITNNPNNGGREGPRKKHQSSTENESIEMVLRQIADQYSSGTGTTKGQTKKKLDKIPMTKDEMAFLEEVKEKNKDKIKEDKSTDWFSILRASHKTYTKVRSTFEKAGIDVEATDNITSALANEVAAKTVYSKLEELFDIPEQETKAFAKKGEKAISDWARFVEENRQ